MGYNSSEVQTQKLNSEENDQSQNAKNGIEKTAEESTNIRSKTISSVEGKAIVEMSSHGDTVEISEQGMSKRQSMSKPQKAVPIEQTETSEVSSAAAAAVEALTSDESSDSTDSSDLSQYSEYELKNMLAEGTISRSKYIAEIESRKGSTDSSENDENLKYEEDLLNNINPNSSSFIGEQ
jgi:hypothetical protein